MTTEKRQFTRVHESSQNYYGSEQSMENNRSEAGGIFNGMPKHLSGHKSTGLSPSAFQFFLQGKLGKMLLKETQAKSPLSKKLPPANQVTTLAKELELKEDRSNSRASVDIPWWQQASRLSHYTQRPRKAKIPGDDLYFCARPYLLVGKILGVIPLQGLWTKNLEDVRFRTRSMATFVSMCQLVCVASLTLMSLGQLLSVFFNSHGDEGSSRSVILSSRGPILLAYSTIIQYTFLRHGRNFANLLQSWRFSSAALTLTTEKISIFRKANLLTFGILIIGISHVILVQLSRLIPIIIDADENVKNRTAMTTNTSALESYYGGTTWSRVVPYNAVTFSFIAVTRLFSVFSWQYTEGLLLLLAKLLAFKFQTLYEQSKLRISPPKNIPNTLTMFRKTSIEIIWRENLWADLRKDHLICLQLLRETDRIISPLVFLFYAVNIFLICIQVHEGVTPANLHDSVLNAILSASSLIFLLKRLILMSLLMARISENAHSVIKCVQKCPNHLYTSELERLERMLSNNTIGLSGLGCFVVTKAFLLVVGSVIFTFQVVLMQTQSDASDIVPVFTSSA